MLILVCSMPGLLLLLKFVPRQLFLEVKRRSVSAHSAINSYCMQYGNYRMCGAMIIIDKDTLQIPQFHIQRLASCFSCHRPDRYTCWEENGIMDSV